MLSTDIDDETGDIVGPSDEFDAEGWNDVGEGEPLPLRLCCCTLFLLV